MKRDICCTSIYLLLQISCTHFESADVRVYCKLNESFVCTMAHISSIRWVNSPLHINLLWITRTDHFDQNSFKRWSNVPMDC